MNNKNNKEKDLIGVLKILKKARAKLISDFLDRSPLIYIPIFKYENNTTLMNIALENYFISWINYHFVIGDNCIDSQTQKEEFIKTMYLFIRKHLAEAKGRRLTNYKFIKELLQHKCRLLQKFMNVGDQATINLNRLIMEYEKDKALFQRQINKFNKGV